MRAGVHGTPVGSQVPALDELAELHGVSRAYLDNQGAEHRADPGAVAAALAAMGVPIDHPDGAAEALRSLEVSGVSPLQPVVVHWTGTSTVVTTVLPRHMHPRDVWLTVELEAGEEQRMRMLSVVSRPLTSETVHGRQVDRYELRLWSAGDDLPIGYHHLTVEIEGSRYRSLVISAPRCPRPERGWGAFMPLHAVRGRHDRGIGTYSDLGELAEWIGGLGGSFLGTLPLLPTFLEGDPVDPSPYLPVSRLAWNEVFVDPTVLPEFGRSEQARQSWGHDGAPRLGLVDYPAAARRLRSTLAPMVRELLAGGSERRDQFTEFVAERPHLEAYAAFRSTGTFRPDSTDGSAWPGQSSTGSGGDASAGADRADAAGSEILYAQWAAETQLEAAAARGAGLYLDLPVGIHPSGFDPVWEPGAFVSGVTGGAPPDDFFAGGQDWGFPPLDPQGLRAGEYRYFAASLRHAMMAATVVRLDHVMSLRRLFWIPAGGVPSDGVYVEYPAEEMRAVVALEAARAGTVVVGEDLGTVPDGLRVDMAHDRMLRSWVLQFDTSVDEPLPEPPMPALAGWGTHDLPTFAAYWEGRDLDDRTSSGSLDPAKVATLRSGRAAWREALASRLGIAVDQPAQALRGCLDHLAAGQALLTIVDLEDLWLEVEPQNRPGTGAGGSNWRRRSARSIAEIRSDPAVASALTVVDGLRRSTGIAPLPSPRPSSAAEGEEVP